MFGLFAALDTAFFFAPYLLAGATLAGVPFVPPLAGEARPPLTIERSGLLLTADEDSSAADRVGDMRRRR